MVTATNSRGVGGPSSAVTVVAEFADSPTWANSVAAGVKCFSSYDAFNNSASVNIKSTVDWSCNVDLRKLFVDSIPDHQVAEFPNTHNPNSISTQAVKASFLLQPKLTASLQQLVALLGVVRCGLNDVEIVVGTADTCRDGDAKYALEPLMQSVWSIEALGQDTFNFGEVHNHAHA